MLTIEALLSKETYSSNPLETKIYYHLPSPKIRKIHNLNLAKRIIDLCGSRSHIVETPRMKDDPDRRCSDIKMAIENIDWEPIINLGYGLKRTIEWFQNNINR